jgi:hypothetical protein
MLIGTREDEFVGVEFGRLVGDDVEHREWQTALPGGRNQRRNLGRWIESQQRVLRPKRIVQRSPIVKP